MEKRQLGRSGLHVAPWCFGGNVFGWTADKAMSFRLLDAFVDAGFDFIDTADVYSRWVEGHKGGESEEIIGEWLAARRNRDKLIVATKVGIEMGPGKEGLAKSYIVEAVESSLKRLQTDYIDLYQSHRDDPKTPVEETLEAYASLVKAGKIRVIGASNFSTDRLREALDLAESRDLPRYESLQPEYNLYSRSDFENGLQALCVERQVGVIPYYSLASGFLTGKYRSKDDFGKSPRAARGMDKYLDERGMRILAALDDVSEAHGASQAEVALAWLLAQPSITAPIASATKPEQFHDLAGAVALNLSKDELATLDKASR